MIKQMVLAGAMTGLCFAAPLEAQRPASASLGITPYAGYIKFGNIANGPLGTSLRNAGAAVYGAELSLGLAPSLALVGNVAYSQPNLQIGAPIVGGLSVGQTSALLYDAALRLRVPTGGLLPISPFIQAGAGAIRRSVTVDPVSTHETNFAYNVGAGADVAIAPHIGLQLMAKDYIGKFDAKEATGLNVDTKTSHNWSVSAGLRIGL